MFSAREDLVRSDGIPKPVACHVLKTHTNISSVAIFGIRAYINRAGFSSGGERERVGLSQTSKFPMPERTAPAVFKILHGIGAVTHSHICYHYKKQ
jgi:hypothetical protein